MIFVRPTKKNKYVLILLGEGGVIDDLVYMSQPSKPNFRWMSTSEKDKLQKEYELDIQKFEEKMKTMKDSGYVSAGSFVFEGTVSIAYPGRPIEECHLENGKKIRVFLARDQHEAILKKVCDGSMSIKGDMVFHGVWELVASSHNFYIKPSELI